MGWITSSTYLNQSQMQNNANIIIDYYRSIGINDKTISAILGNMQAESTLNPILDEVGGSGYGLVQWTPKSVLQNHASTLGLSPYTDGTVQIKVLIEEIKGTSNVGEWYSSQAFVSNYYNSGATSDMIGISGLDFLNNTMNWEPDKLAILFMSCYERPSYDPSVNHYTQRQSNALNWYSYINNTSIFIPRLNTNGMSGSKYWYSTQNPFYPNYGLPNCTCYAWGRFWEINEQSGHQVTPRLNTNDAHNWYGYTSDGYQRGSTPKLGAVACWYNNNTPNQGGHVAIVEEINNNGDFVCSNSAYNSTYFYLKTIRQSDNYNMSGYTFQGFIYNPYSGSTPGPTPGPIVNKRNNFNFVLFNKRRRNLHG